MCMYVKCMLDKRSMRLLYVTVCLLSPHTMRSNYVCSSIYIDIPALVARVFLLLYLSLVSSDVETRKSALSFSVSRQILISFLLRDRFI